MSARRTAGKDRTMTNVYMSADDRAQWQMDVDECPDCAICAGEAVCSEHDLDDETVALRYSGSGEERS